MNKLKSCILFLIGGLIYILIEIVWRGHSHWTMCILGGLCFLYAGYQNERIEWNYPLLLQALRVTIFIVVMEFITGCIVNIWLGWDVWDYSDLPLNLYGQICLYYAILWYGLSIVAIVLDDYIRYWLFSEDKPHYKMI